jgi:hypothetical protein
MINKLQPLEFEAISDNGEEARYRALVTGQGAVLAVTLTIASPVKAQAEKQLQELFSRMKAGFTLLFELPPDSGESVNGESGTDEPFDIEQQLGIELSVASFDDPRAVGVAVTVQTTTGIVPVPAGSDPVSGTPVTSFLGSNLRANLDDYWQASPEQVFTATVRPSAGQGTIRNASSKKPPTPVHPHGPYQMSATAIIVHAGPNVALDYSLDGAFIRTGHNVQGG